MEVVRGDERFIGKERKRQISIVERAEIALLEERKALKEVVGGSGKESPIYH